MEKQYYITCQAGQHVKVLDNEEMVRLFGEKTVEMFDADPEDHPPYLPECSECEEAAEAGQPRVDVQALGLDPAALNE